ncbi:DUF3310 domain-containing protein [Listeria sp. FSL L7-1509]|uniref:DUF3310 domain-containing protein n=2 Tax=Listeria immobilis TaxID=2713502 RepID=A0ABR6STQ0_9LIST|nr:DUF3310 domain-containing protein [Listeria immobilis]MBC1508997.1 DUF3310 domain-containing protein [Listeria immobilis]MBC6312393.1 DUF3310 domain-containing protein [Listeria immobilis]
MFNHIRKFINRWKFNQGIYIELMSLDVIIPLNKEDKQMKIYHTETQGDFNALLGKLKNEGYRWRFGDIIMPDDSWMWEKYERETVVFVRESRITYGDIYCANYIHPDTTIEKFKAKKNTEEPSHRPDIITEGKLPDEVQAWYDHAVKAVKTSVINTDSDNINNPAHYTSGGIETLDYIKAKVSDYSSYAVGNILKYVSRYEHKNGLEDLKKAQFYLIDLIKEMESGEE